jgi:hypothetical protein
MPKTRLYLGIRVGGVKSSHIVFAGTRTTTVFFNVGTGAGTRKMPQTKINL